MFSDFFCINEPALSSEKVFKELDLEFGRAGAVLQGARLKEELTQVELAEMLNISQTDLSKMEHGKRTIGKKMAHRLAEALKIDYRVFL
jgi:ribosome-binding protein aMBF1 (putative translation factor)